MFISSSDNHVLRNASTKCIKSALIYQVWNLRSRKLAPAVHYTYLLRNERCILTWYVWYFLCATCFIHSAAISAYHRTWYIWYFLYIQRVSYTQLQFQHTLAFFQFTFCNLAYNFFIDSKIYLESNQSFIKILICI